MLPASQSFQSVPVGLSDITDTERQLARDLDAILAKRPLAYPQPLAKNSIPISPIPVSRSVINLPVASLASSDENETAGFDWIGLADTRTERQIEPSATGTAQWLKRARRERFVERARHGLALIITLVIGGAVIACAAYLLLGTVPGLELILVLGQHTPR